MQLSPSQVERFYGIWFPLQRFVNDKYKLVDKTRLEGAWEPKDAALLKDTLWANNALLESFITQNPANLSITDLEIARGWQNRVADSFLLVKHLKKYSVLISGESKKEGGSTVYGVVGLNCPLIEMYEDLPCMLKGVLLPFEGKITYDSLFIFYPIVFGRNITANLKREYQVAKKCGTIIESLEANSSRTISFSKA